MRSQRIAATALSFLCLSAVACGSSPSGDGTDTAVSESAANPAPDLASAPVAVPGEHARDGVVTNDVRDAIGINANTGGGSSGGGSSGGGAPPAPSDPNAGAGPKPTTTCSVTKDSGGFFVRSTTKSIYEAYVPASYTGTAPMRLIVGLHGCGDSAHNFATWGVNPYDTRATQRHIGISIGGRDGQCWNGSDDDKVLAAVDDISRCFWVHQKKVVIAGYSSGGEIGYRVGLQHASRFAGIIVEDSGLYAAGNPDTLLANAAWKLNVAHLTHTADPVFPLAQVKADWAKMTAAGFPIKTSVTAGDHEGSSADWATWLIPQSAGFAAP